MQQRRLRLGDILDDYCPRERRITNHAVVAMVEDDVKQTRCTTCDAEHEYKQAKLPTLRRKKDSVAKAYQEVLAGVTGEAVEAAPRAVADAPAEQAPQAAPDIEVPGLPFAAAPASAPTDALDGGEPEADGEAATEGGRVHRRLIRATLPRPANQPVERPIPQFTMHQPQGRAPKFRGAGRGFGAGRAAAQGHPAGHGGNNARGGFGRSGSGRPQGQRNEFRQGRGGHPSRPGKKHSK